VVQDVGALALGFHFALTDCIATICEKLKEKYRTNTVALSGGVFQNTVLSEQTLKILRQQGFRVFLNLAVPPNDGGISLGQTYIGLHHKNDSSNI
jgi:hydrogenase maturation protein HypF